MQALRKHFEKVAAFCIRYDYIGATWDGSELTCFTWGRKNQSFANDYLMPNNVSGLNEWAATEINEWCEIETSLRDEKICSFGYGLVQW